MFTHTKELLTTAPAIEPVSVDEVRLHCRVPDTFHDDDAYLATLIVAARTLLEQQCWSSFVTQVWDFWWSSFDSRLFIPRGPLILITKFQYRSTESPYALTEIAAATYETSTENQFPFVRLAYNQTWPTSRGHADDIYMRASLGYGATAASVPMPIRHAIKLLVGDWYSNREETPGGVPRRVESRVDALIGPYRIKEGL